MDDAVRRRANNVPLHSEQRLAADDEMMNRAVLQVVELNILSLPLRSSRRAVVDL